MADLYNLKKGISTLSDLKDGNLASVVGPLGKDAEVFYVSASLGNDAWDGTLEDPFASSQKAIDMCVAGRGDVIVRLPGGEEVTSTVTFNKTGITYIASSYGANPFAIGELFSIYAATSFVDGPVMTMTKRAKIIGIGFAGRDTGATFWGGAAALIGGLGTAAPFGAHILHCRFPKWGFDNRIGLAVEGSSDVIIEGCDFEGVGADFDSGIYVQGATANISIIGNRFRDCTQGIQFGAFAGGGPDCIIQGNVAVHGSLLAAASAAVGVVVDNYIPTLDVGNAYGGSSLATLEGLGLWFADNHYSETP